ncbi:MAG: DUF2854 domain-containing protein [Cyanobacteria bacterium P01_D01_bin.73]
MFRKVPLSWVLLVVGFILTILGFWAYASGNSTLNLVGFFYGIPVLLGGAALKAAELKPVPYRVETSDKVLELRKAQATQTQEQVRKDVTRFRYGQEAHLDEALERLGLSPTDEERPVLHSIVEADHDGLYNLTLSFASPYISFDTWQEKREKIERFFGPNITTDITHGEEVTSKDGISVTLVDVALTRVADAPVATAA